MSADTGMHNERAADPLYKDRTEAFPNPLGRLLLAAEVATPSRHGGPQLLV